MGLHDKNHHDAASTDDVSTKSTNSNKVKDTRIKLVLVNDSNNQRCMVRMLSDSGLEIGTIDVESLTGKSRWALACAIKATVEKWSSRDSSYVYRVPFKGRDRVELRGVVEDLMEKGEVELEVEEHHTSAAEIIFQKALMESKLRFKWRDYLSDYLVDFHIVGRDSIAIDIVEEGGDWHHEMLKIRWKMENLVKRGHLYYWLNGEDVLRDAYGYAKLIEDIVKREKIYPNGFLTKGFKVDKTAPIMEVLIKQQPVHSPSGNRIKFMNAFGMLEPGVIVLGTMRVPVRPWSFAKLLINILWRRGYWYDVEVKSYSTTYRIFREFGKVEFKFYRLRGEPLRLSSIGKVWGDRIEGVKDTDRLA